MIVIVKVTPRRYIAVDTTYEETGWRSTAEGHRRGNGYIYASGTLIAGPADWTTVDNAAYKAAEHGCGQILTADQWEGRQLQQKK